MCKSSFGADTIGHLPWTNATYRVGRAWAALSRQREKLTMGGKKEQRSTLNRYFLSGGTRAQTRNCPISFLSPRTLYFPRTRGNWRTKTFYRRSVSPSDGNNSEFPCNLYQRRGCTIRVVRGITHQLHVPANTGRRSAPRAFPPMDVWPVPVTAFDDNFRCKPRYAHENAFIAAKWWYLAPSGRCCAATQLNPRAANWPPRLQPRLNWTVWT